MHMLICMCGNTLRGRLWNENITMKLDVGVSPIIKKNQLCWFEICKPPRKCLHYENWVGQLKTTQKVEGDQRWLGW